MEKTINNVGNGLKSKFSGRRITKDEINKLYIKRYEGPVHVIRNLGELAGAIRRLEKETILGFDTETRPVYTKGEKHPPATLQLASEKEVFVFQLKHLGLPKPLRKILSRRNIIKTGVALAYDISELVKLAQFKPAGFVELESLAEQAGVKNFGLRGLAAALLGFRIPKNSRTSNWSRDTLTPTQIKYAATDAWVGLELYKKLREITREEVAE